MHGAPARVGSKDLSRGSVEFCSQQIISRNYLAVGTGIQPADKKTMEPHEVNWGALGLHPEPGFCTPLERISSLSTIPAVKFLGVYFDCDLNFKYHIRTICSKILRSLYMLMYNGTKSENRSLRSFLWTIQSCTANKLNYLYSVLPALLSSASQV